MEPIFKEVFGAIYDYQMVNNGEKPGRLSIGYDHWQRVKVARSVFTFTQVDPITGQIVKIMGLPFTICPGQKIIIAHSA
jgi:hypothetical protein